MSARERLHQTIQNPAGGIVPVKTWLPGLLEGRHDEWGAVARAQAYRQRLIEQAIRDANVFGNPVRHSSVRDETRQMLPDQDSGLRFGLLPRTDRAS